MDSVLNFPQLWQRPSCNELMACLRSLEVKPTIWTPGTRLETTRDTNDNYVVSPQFNKEVAMYLSSIVSNPLKWIDENDDKELIWNEAGKRISERSGRFAMGDMTRVWPFPEQASLPFELSIREPSITGDYLGFKTWGSSFLLALELPRLTSSALSHLFAKNASPSILELGSGTGLLGIAAAAIWKQHVVLSDLPDIVGNLAHNVETNKEIVKSLGGSMETGILTWGSQDEFDVSLFSKRNQYKIILAADGIYDEDHPELLYSAITQHLSLDEDARAVVMVPQRDAPTVKYTKRFHSLMGNHYRPLECLIEGELDQTDDWGSGDGQYNDDEDRTKCWWGVFGAGRFASACQQ